MDEFLRKIFFNSPEGLLADETNKTNMIIFHEFFSIVDKLYPLLEKTQPQLAERLKLKLANMPLRDEKRQNQWRQFVVIPVDRKQFRNVYLSKKNQLDILIRTFAYDEKTHLNTLIRSLSNCSPCGKDINKISKFASTYRSHLAPDNVVELRSALEKTVFGKQNNAFWDDPATIRNELIKKKPLSIFSYAIASVLNLHRAAKAREFFQKQEKFNEEEIQIPRWYHATKPEFVKRILSTAQIEVRSVCYLGAWVSNKWEMHYGTTVFAFNDEITKLDINPAIHTENRRIRWRGLQKHIPFVKQPGMENPAIPFLCFVGYDRQSYGINKNTFITELKAKGIKDPVVFSNSQLQYIQMKILEILGSPNLSGRYWGKADDDNLERPSNGFFG